MFLLSAKVRKEGRTDGRKDGWKDGRMEGRTTVALLYPVVTSLARG
jgi:hypothetical protein